MTGFLRCLQPTYSGWRLTWSRLLLQPTRSWVMDRHARQNHYVSDGKGGGRTMTNSERNGVVWSEIDWNVTLLATNRSESRIEFSLNRKRTHLGTCRTQTKNPIKNQKNCSTIAWEKQRTLKERCPQGTQKRGSMSSVRCPPCGGIGKMALIHHQQRTF